MFNNIFKRKKKNSDDIVELNNEFGEGIKFHFLDLVEYKEKEYVILLPVNSDDGMVVILEIISDDNADKEEYISVDDNNILEEIYNIFKHQRKNDFDFID